MALSSFAQHLLDQKWIKGIRAVGYGRVSTDSEDQQNSLENQINFFSTYFQENGFQMVKDCGVLYKRDGTRLVLQGVYADEGITATKNKGRKGLQKLIEDAEARKFDVIFTKNVQRFGRNLEESINVYKRLKALGIAFYFLDVHLSSLDGEREFLLNLFLSNAQEDSRSKSKAVQWGMRQEQLKGKWTGMPMFGYSKVDGHLVKDEEEGMYYIEAVNKFYYEGYGTRKVSNYFYEKEVHTKRGNRRWDSGSVTHMLTNPIYCGLQVQHTMQNMDINLDLIESIDPEDYICKYDPNLAYIDIDFYNRVQIERTNRHPNCTKYRQVKLVDGEYRLLVFEVNRDKSELMPSTRHSNKHLFSNVLFCGNCGWAHTRKLKKEGKEPYHYWCCSRNHKYGKTECEYTNRIREAELLDMVKSELEEFRSNREERIWYFDAYVRSRFPIHEDKESVLESLDSQVEKLENQRQLNFELLSEKLIDKTEFKDRKEKLDAQLEELRSKQNAIRQREQEIENLRSKFDESMRSLEELDMNTMTNAEIRQIIESIQVYTNPYKLKNGKAKDAKQINIQWRFLDNSTEGQVFLEYMHVQSEDWNRNVWYKGKTPEQIQEIEEREEMVREWEQSPEGQQHLQEQDELRREIMKQEQLQINAKK